MFEFFAGLAEQIEYWWEFLWSTSIPGTDFSFGGLYSFMIFLSLFIFIVNIASKHDESKGGK